MDLMMTNEERRIREADGNRNPFRVPEGYFEQFDERLMAALPEARTRQSRTVRLVPRLWRYAAALLVVAGLGTALYLGTPGERTLTAETEEEFYNEELDYVMVGNMEIAEYLTEAE